MNRLVSGCALAAATLAAAPAFAQNLPVDEALANHVWCSRTDMQAAVDSYLAAQRAGDPSLMNAADEITFVNSREAIDADDAIVNTPVGVDNVLTLKDEYACETFSEVIDADGEVPRVIGVHLTLTPEGEITEVDTLVTDPGDWLFNAQQTLYWTRQEDWGRLPEGQRGSRQDLRDAANSYLDLFNDKTVDVPWAEPCRRLEGGAYTGASGPNDSCELGVPDGVGFPVRDYVIDPELGAIVALVPFGGPGGLPDSHLFRVAYGKITNVHTITVCRDSQVCPQIASCTRDDLQAAVDSYLAAQGAGDPRMMTLADNAAYREQFQTADMESGIVSTPLNVDFTNTLLDVGKCQTFTEVVVTDPEHPYVLGVHLTLNAAGEISEVDAIVTDDDDWLFSAEKFMAGIQNEDWGMVPEDQRDNRETIIAAADPYFPMFKDVALRPAVAEPCYRQEGAMRTNGTCHLTTPLNVNFGPREYLVDEAKGMVVALVLFNDDLPDSHLFRVRNGKVTNIHTITNCMGDFNCNFDLSPDLRAEREARGGLIQ